MRFERAPFDHPRIFVPHGHPGAENSVTDVGSGRATRLPDRGPPVGANGIAQPPKTFLNLPPTEPSP